MSLLRTKNKPQNYKKMSKQPSFYPVCANSSFICTLVTFLWIFLSRDIHEDSNLAELHPEIIAGLGKIATWSHIDSETFNFFVHVFVK